MNSPAEFAMSKSYEAQIGQLDIYESYKRSPYLSIKHSSYFQIYTDLLEGYRSREITFVEVGVLNGGSLFMWRDYFGPKARIIGVDFNPGAKKWEAEGFEIFIGSQADPNFWQSFFKQIGPVDIVLDDGGHTFEQQIVTAHECIPNIKENGLLIVEDTHTSYFEEFGYPSPYSFIEWTKKLVDNVNSRFPRVKVSNLPYKNSIYSISIFESIVSFKIRRSSCFESAPTSNDGISSNAKDFRLKGSSIEATQDRVTGITNRFKFLKKMNWLRNLYLKFLPRYQALIAHKELTRLEKYFKG